VLGNRGWAGVSRCGGIGDNLVASSVLPGLKKRFGHVEVITQEPYHVIFENNPFCDKLSVHKEGDIKAEGVADWNWIRAKEFEFYVNLSHTMELTLAFFPAQFQFQWPAEARRKFANKSYLEQVHDVALVPYDEIAPGFFPTEEENAQAAATMAEIGERFIVWVMRGTRLDKVYPHAPTVVARLLRETGLPVVLLGAPKDGELASALHDEVVRINGNSAGLHIALSPTPAANTWPIRRSLTLAQHAALVIGPDTGVLWSAAMDRDIPKIVLLSHASPVNITKHWRNVVTLYADQGRVPCWPCHRLHDVFETCVPNADKSGSACISDIPVDMIVKHALARLKGSRLPFPLVSEPVQVMSPLSLGEPLAVPTGEAADGE
jgi:ADP-heptose:LPS heptosyltransferase